MKNRKSATATAIGKLQPPPSALSRRLNPSNKERSLDARYKQGFAAARSAAVQLVQEQFDRELASIRREIEQQLHSVNLTRKSLG